MSNTHGRPTRPSTAASRHVTAATAATGSSSSRTHVQSATATSPAGTPSSLGGGALQRPATTTSIHPTTMTTPRSHPVLDRMRPSSTSVTIADGNDDDEEVMPALLAVPSSNGRRLLEAKLTRLKAQEFDEAAALAEIEKMGGPRHPWQSAPTTATSTGAPTSARRSRPASASSSTTRTAAPLPSSSSVSASTTPTTTVAVTNAALGDAVVGGRWTHDPAARVLNVARDRSVYSNLTPITPPSTINHDGIKSPVYLPGTSRSRSARRSSDAKTESSNDTTSVEADGVTPRRVSSKKKSGSGKGSNGGGATLSSARWSAAATGSAPPNIMDLYSADMVAPPRTVVSDAQLWQPLPSMAAHAASINASSARHRTTVRPSFSTDDDAGAFMFDKIMLRWP